MDIKVRSATFFQTYSTFLARPGIWLDDLYVQPHMRGQGVGAALMNRLAAIALRRDCGRIEMAQLGEISYNRRVSLPENQV